MSNTRQIRIVDDDPELRDALSEQLSLYEEFKAGDGSIDRMETLAKELVGLKPDMLVAMTTPATAALQAATRTIPIVFAAVSDPVGSGFAAFTDKW